MKQFILTCVKAIDAMSRWTENIGRYLILPMIGVVCYEVVVRRFFNAPTTWAMDILGMLFGVFIIWSGGPSVLAKSQVCMDAVYNMWKPRTKAIVNSFTYTLAMSFCTVLAWQATKYAIQSWQTKELANTILSQPLYHWRIFLAAGTWLLNPLFRLLARVRAREVMTAAALMVVLGAALLMEIGGLSMAMGAFLAGVLLSGSTFRHQLEADIEPFRGLLLGLFFLAVGMALDLAVVASNWPLIAAGVLAMMATKAACIYVAARTMRSSHAEALDRAVLMAQGGEFAFVLFSAAQAAGVIDGTANANLTAIVVLSMALTPLVVLAMRRFTAVQASASADGVEVAQGLSGSVLIIGFGRFGQVVSQALLSRDVDVTIIDTDIEMIASASEFGFKVYYGDGRRADVLRACGAASTRAIAVCVDDRQAASQIARMCRQLFPQARILVRAFDREHALELVGLDVHYQVRETFESALRFGQAALEALDMDAEVAAQVAAEVRQRDGERFALEVAAGDVRAGTPLIIGNTAPATPTPFTVPRRESKRLDPAAAEQAAAPVAAQEPQERPEA